MAKTLAVFKDLRTSINYKTSSGAKKIYLAIVHGKVLVPNDSDKGGWGKSNITMKWDTQHNKSVQWDDERDAGNAGLGRDTGGRNEALTYFRPLKYFSRHTLLQLQIVTGARHQIRFHCSAMGHPLIGDVKYGASHKDREWAGRVALHAYRVEVYEPGTWNDLKAVAPLPPDMLKMLLQLEPSEDATELPGAKEEGPLLTREDHPQLGSLFQMSKDTFRCKQFGVVSPPVVSWHGPGREVSPSPVSTPPPWPRHQELVPSSMSPPPPWPRHQELASSSMSPPPPWPRRHPTLTPPPPSRPHASLSPLAQWPPHSPATPWSPTSPTPSGVERGGGDNDGRIERLRVAAKRRREAREEAKEQARVLHLRYLVLRRRLAKQRKQEVLSLVSCDASVSQCSRAAWSLQDDIASAGQPRSFPFGAGLF